VGVGIVRKLSAGGSGLLLGDIFGLLALALISATAVLMLLRKMILKRFRNLELLRRLHIAVAGLGGLFLILHVAYFITWPVTVEILLGYVSASLALVVWLTGTAFLERFRDSLYFHGTLSLSAISLMVIHSAAAGLNVPFAFAEVVLGGTSAVAVYKSAQYLGKMKGAGGVRG
jgi:intracellular septation protein A